MLIYKATSKTTGKIYVGQTSQTLQTRINQHKSHSDSKKYHFYNAIRKYGFDDFIFEIIEDGIEDKEYLNEREKYWIEYYDSYYNGYNSTFGGDGKTRRDDKLILDLFLDGKNIKEISEITGYSRNAIRESFKINNVSEENKERQVAKFKERFSKKVEQYTIDGEFIQTWNSATEAGKYYGQESLISAICRQQEHILTAYGFLFKYQDDERPIEQWVERYKNKKSGGKKKKKIAKLDDNKKVIEIYNSGAEAAKALGKEDKSNICSAARNGRRAYGYYWEYVK